MSSLTEQERIGLEEVFLSIRSKQKQTSKLIQLSRDIGSLFKEHYQSIKALKSVKAIYHIQKRLKSPILGCRQAKTGKKKKKLS